MKTFARLFLLVGLLVFSTPVQARRKQHASPPGADADLSTPAPEPAALPPEAAPRISPDAPPSVSLGPFLDRHLTKVLAPLGQSAFAQPELLASMKASYADGMATAPANHKPAYVMAQGVCDALNGAMTERQTAVAALRGALATRSSEADQPRGGGEAVAKAKSEDQFFIDSQKNTWIQRSELLGKNITALYLREREIERQIGAWAPPPPPPAPTPVAVAPAPAAAPTVAAGSASIATPPTSGVAPPAEPTTTPSVSVAASEQDPVAGLWTWAGHQLITIGANHDVAGERHGTWRLMSTTGDRRSYQFRWRHAGWVSTVVLSSDGKSLSGTDQAGDPVSATRR